MSFKLEKNFEKDCSKDPETCDLVKGLFVDDIFYSLVAEEDPKQNIRDDALDCRRIIANVFDACNRGNCLGQQPALFDEIIRRRKEGK